VYLDNLLIALSKTGVGCYIGPTFVGALAYADDIVLIAPTAIAMCQLLALCDSCSRDYCISFNALKTKCMIVTPNKRRSFSSRLDSCCFRIDNKPIEFVSSYPHLGHLITSSLSNDEDVVKRRGEFIGQVNNVICYCR
jgi:hypothetical protein